MIQSTTGFVDSQVRLVIKKYPDCCIIEILEKCKDEFPMFEWHYKKVWDSVCRLANKENASIEIYNSTVKRVQKFKYKTIEIGKHAKRVRQKVISNGTL